MEVEPKLRILWRRDSAQLPECVQHARTYAQTRTCCTSGGHKGFTAHCTLYMWWSRAATLRSSGTVLNMTEACRVAVRLRPLLKGESIATDKLLLEDGSVKFHRQGVEKLYSVDRTFVPSATQVSTTFMIQPSLSQYIGGKKCFSAMGEARTMCRKMCSPIQLPQSSLQFSKEYTAQFSHTVKQEVGKPLLCKDLQPLQGMCTPAGMFQATSYVWEEMSCQSFMRSMTYTSLQRTE